MLPLYNSRTIFTMAWDKNINYWVLEYSLHIVFTLYHYKAIRSFCTVELRVILKPCSITPSQEVVALLVRDPEYIIHPPKSGSVTVHLKFAKGEPKPPASAFVIDSLQYISKLPTQVTVEVSDLTLKKNPKLHPFTVFDFILMLFFCKQITFLLLHIYIIHLVSNELQ